MNTNKKSGCTLQVILFAFVITSAFLTYDAKSALSVILVLNSLTFLSSFAGFIPIAGVVLYWFICKRLVIANFFIWFPEINPSWFTVFIFWYGFVLSAIWSFVSIGYMSGGKKNSSYNYSPKY